MNEARSNAVRLLLASLQSITHEGDIEAPSFDPIRAPSREIVIELESEAGSADPGCHQKRCFRSDCVTARCKPRSAGLR